MVNHGLGIPVPEEFTDAYERAKAWLKPHGAYIHDDGEWENRVVVEMQLN